MWQLSYLILLKAGFVTAACVIYVKNINGPIMTPKRAAVVFRDVSTFPKTMDHINRHFEFYSGASWSVFML